MMYLAVVHNYLTSKLSHFNLNSLILICSFINKMYIIFMFKFVIFSMTFLLCRLLLIK